MIANGTPYALRSGTTVAEFVRQRGLDPALVVVEHNGEALHRSRYDDVRLTDGDRIEVVRAVAGG